ASPDVLRLAVQLTDLLVTRPLRPVRAESSPGVLAHGVDVNVSTDGMNLLVNATNTLATPQSFTLVPAAPRFTYTIPDASTPPAAGRRPATRAQSESMLRYVRAAIPPNAIPSLTPALNQAVAAAAAAVANLATQAPTFDTRAAQQLLLRLGTLSTQSQPE